MSDDNIPNEQQIADSEVLYRSIRPRPEEVYFDSEGQLRVSPQAFADKSKQPSLYRHLLCDAPPYSNPPRMGPDQAVVTLIAGDIRERAGPIDHRPEKQEPVRYVIDVKPDLSNHQHRSHAVVFANPEFKTNGAFEKLKLRLAQLIEAENWAIKPDETFLEQIRPE
jgi:hypothetical protein